MSKFGLPWTNFATIRLSYGNMAARSRLILQSDWGDVLRDLNGKAWVTFSSSGAKTHGELKCIGVSSDGNPYVEGSHGFSVPSISKYKISVKYEDGATHSCTSSFQAPSVSFTTIHSERKQVLSLDVTCGGLGVSADSESRLVVWTTDNGEVRRKLEGHLGDVYTCRFFPSGVVVVSGGMDMMLKIWSVDTGQCAASLLGHKAGITDTAIVERGRNVVSCSKDGTAKLWDIGKQACLSTFNVESGVVNACCLGSVNSAISLGTPQETPSEREVLTEGKMLLLACENGNLQGYGLQSRNKVFSVKCTDAVNCCSFVSSTLCMTGTQDGVVTVYDIRNTSQNLHTWKADRGPVLSLLPLNDKVAISTSDGSCYSVDINNWNTVTEYTGSDCDPIYTVSSDGSAIYSGCRDGLIRKYKL